MSHFQNHKICQCCCFLKVKEHYLYEPADLLHFVIFFHLVQVVRRWASDLFSWKIWKAQPTIFFCIVKAKLLSSSLKETFKKCKKAHKKQCHVKTSYWKDKNTRKKFFRNYTNSLGKYIDKKERKTFFAWDSHFLSKT